MLEDEYKFICDLWNYIKKHRQYTPGAWTDGDELLRRYEDIPYAPDMVKAYLDTI